MISKLVEQRVRELEYGLPENIRQIQLQNIPVLSDINLVEKDNYKYNGNTYTATGKRVFLAYNLPIKSAINKKHIFNKALQVAVDEDLIHPFILFINGKAIKWSDIDIVVDYKYSYLLINTAETIDGLIYHKGFTNGFINSITGIISADDQYPNSIYGDEVLYKKGISYTINGYNSYELRKWDASHNYIGTDSMSGSYTFIPSNDFYGRVLFSAGANISEFKIIGRYGLSAQKIIKIPYRVRYGEDNIVNINYHGNFYFDTQGLLVTDTSKIAMRVEIISSELNCSASTIADSASYVEVLTDTDGKPATTDNILTFKNGSPADHSSYLSNNGLNIFSYAGDATGCIFKTFYYNKSNISNDNIYNLTKSIIKGNIVNKTSTTYMNKLRESLDLDISPYDIFGEIFSYNMERLKVLSISKDKFFVCFTDKDNSNKGTAFIVDCSSGSLVIGVSYIFNNAGTGSLSAINIDSNRILLVFADASNNLNGKAIVVTISGMYMILGNPALFSDDSIIDLSVVRMSATKFVIAYSNLANSSYGTVQMITFFNDYISIKTTPRYVFISESISNLSLINVSNDYVCIAYIDSLGYGAANVLSADDVGIIISNKCIFNSGATSNISGIRVNNSRIVLSYIDEASHAVAQILDIDGNSISVTLSKNVFNSNVTTYLRISKIDDEHITVIFDNNTKVAHGILNIINDSISYQYNGIAECTNVKLIDMISVYDKIVIAYTDTVNGKGYMNITHNLYNELNMRISKIMSYNPKLFDSVYSGFMPFETVTYTGAQINAKKDVDGYVSIPRRRYNNIFCYVMMFVNGELYEYYDTITYINDTFKILAGTYIADTDTIELVFIKNVDNSISSLTITSKDIPIVMNTKFNENNFNLFSTQSNSRSYTLDEEIIVNYNIPFTVIDNGDSNYNITLADDFYYGKTLNVISDNIFRYKKIAIENNQVDVALGEDFKYCINKDNYMVFINGRLISSENFQLGVPNKYNPFDQAILYINIILIPGDEIEVFYLPFKSTVVYTANILPSNGDVVVNSSLPFSLSRNNYWFFINGKKINPKDINDISDSRINIKTDYNSINNFNVVQYMDPMPVLSELISNQDNWNDVISFLGSSITDFYQYTTLTDNETNIKVNETDMKATILEAFRQYYAKYNISSNSLLFNFNDILIDENDKDPSGNYIIRSSDSNQNNNVDVDR